MSALIEPALTGQPGHEDHMRRLLAGPDPGPVGERVGLLHFTGRRSGRAFVIPAGVHPLGGALVVATSRHWRHNFAGGADGQLTWRGRCHQARYRLLPDTVRTARGYLELYQRYGETASRRLGIAVQGPEPVTQEDFRAAVERHGLSLVDIFLLDGLPKKDGHEQGATERSQE
jgi:hypothetical protein